MEFDLVDEVDLEWQNLQQNFLKTVSPQIESTLYSYEEVLGKVFCPDAKVEEEVNYRDKEICEKCLLESLNVLLKRHTTPRPAQIHFIFTLAKYTMRDETCFLHLNVHNVPKSLIYLSQSSNIISEKKTSILLIELVDSLLEHQSGVKELIDSKVWIIAYKLILGHQNIDKDVSTIGHKVLTALLQKINSLNTDICCDIIQTISGPLLNAAYLIETRTALTETKNVQLIEELKPSILCLVEILERLLEEYAAGVLNCTIQLKVDVTSDAISKITHDKSIRLILHRITIILSFFKLTDIFDGIKSINQDPLAITGFIRIVEMEIEKGAPDLVFELYYYALKYLKKITEKFPKCALNGKNFDIEIQLLACQLEPMMVLSERLKRQHFIKVIEGDFMKLSYCIQVFQKLNLDTLKVGFKMQEILPSYPIEVYTNALRCINRSTDLYSKENLGSLLEGLIFCLQDTVDYIKLGRKVEEPDMSDLHPFILELLKGILLLIESFNLSWVDSTKILELAHILISGCTLYQRSSEIVVQGLKLLQEVISRRLSPTMSLLIDSAEDLRELCPVLHQKCFTTEWEVRQSVLDVVHAIAVSANKSFPSFRQLLIDSSLPQLISTMALNDASPLVRSTAFKSLHEIIKMEDMEKILPKSHFIAKVLDVLISDTASLVKKEAIKLISISYVHRDELERKILSKVYNCLEYVALTNPDGDVQIEALEFWGHVIKKHLSGQGWMDRKFPSVTFSKRIVCMTKEEIRKRIYKVLNDLRLTGCLNVLAQISQTNNLHPEAIASLNKKIVQCNAVLRENDATPENMLIYEGSSHIPQTSSDGPLRPPNSVESSDSDKIIQSIINDTLMKMMPDDLEFVQNEDLYSLMDSRLYCGNRQPTPEAVPQTSRQVTPSEFVKFVYERVSYLETKPDGIDEYLKDSEPIIDDMYNINDY